MVVNENTLESLTITKIETKILAKRLLNDNENTQNKNENENRFKKLTFVTFFNTDSRSLTLNSLKKVLRKYNASGK